ncbi:MAG: monomethylamine:corrinoid methyltransferase [Methanomassiliicoccaceae archaeon]|jgi:methylamine--corrinoid protein Co-methyltransferase|nr:monomethylamine:corrinoid methyltransferase [Methanomassiliicoccaceae archaeon]
MTSERALNVFDVYDRFVIGERVPADEWNYRTIPANADRLKRKYRLEFGRNIIPDDKAIKKDLFAAGLEMLVSTGFYNADMERVMDVTESEVAEGIRKAPKQLTFGEGRDLIRTCTRRSNISLRPTVRGGPAGAPVSEDIFVKVMRSYAQEAVVDTIVNGTMPSAGGHPAIIGTPYGMRACATGIRAAREACIAAGRPGMSVHASGPGRAPHMIPERSGPHVQCDLPQLSELKINMTVMNMLALSSVSGGAVMIEQMPIFGGYCGGAEETAICDVAATLASFALFNGSIHLDCPVHIRWGITTARETLQVAGHAAAAIDANTDLLIGNQCCTAAGPCTEMCLLETAAQAICATASGRELISGPASAKGAAQDKTTGMEARIMGEAAGAAAGIKAGNINMIIDDIVSGYENDYANAPAGKTFRECYCADTVKPAAEYMRVYDGAVRKLRSAGLNIW